MKKKEEVKLSEKEWKEKVWKAKINNPKLKILMNLSQYKEKGKDGKWKDKVNFGVLISKGLKKTKDPNSFLGKVFKAFKPKPTDEALAKENKELHERMNIYSKLLTMSVEEILQYVTKAKDGIEKIEDSFIGFFSLRDKKLAKEIMEGKDNDNNDHDPVTQLSHKKREINELKNQLNHYKIQISDLESELDKVCKKEKMYKTKLSLSQNDFDEMKRDFENRVSEYKHALYDKDEENTKLRENAKNLEKEMRENSTKVSGHTYELESTRKKLAEAKHHQDMLTKKLREYEEVVRVINKNLKKNTSQNTESNLTSKHKEGQIDKYKTRFRILEDELHKREDVNLTLKATIQKLNKDVEHRDEQINKMITRRLDQDDVSGTEKKNKQYDSQIEVLKEMITGLKAQIKAKEMDGYRQETKIVSLQSQIDVMRSQEKKLYSMVDRTHPSGYDYAPSSINKKINSGSANLTASRESKRTKPLIKSTPKVTKDPKKDKYSVLDEIMKTPSKNDILASKTANKQNTKPNILVKLRNNAGDESESERMNQSQYSQ
jgi:predicted  nucleic acid-binding Zn-ribbon protein